MADRIDEIKERYSKPELAYSSIRVMSDVKHLLSRIEILESLKDAAYDCLQDGDYHGEDCPGDDYDLPEGEKPGECECGIVKWRKALKDCRAAGVIK